MRALVLGSGIVGRAAAWDMSRRGHEVTVADVDASVAHRLGEELGLSWKTLDVTDMRAVDTALSANDAVISAVPYLFGVSLAKSAVANRCHYFDFGGNPTVVKQQLVLDDEARAADLAIVPDCGLAPGMANVMAAGLIEAHDDAPIDDVQIRVGVLPAHPTGTLQYQLAFYAGGLINEYAEPCEVIENGAASTVEPLTRFESLEWPEIGTLEAFSTAGGTSTMCQQYLGRVQNLEYKTIRYPGHGRIFAAMREIGLFATDPADFGGVAVAPRTVLQDLLTDRLPQGGPDLALVDVAVTAGGVTKRQRIRDEHDGEFSALARTTAFPATALCDLIDRGEVGFRGAAAMHTATPADLLLTELSSVNIIAENQ
ncbi:MAG: saccharopine dehydrogenase C-terminal domain-containing protein [Acidimicrobiia bacterium]|nr:saccharopine dehydrogenase C-terminal domain-containing protein [Acidimicrobiia bacterium]